MGWGATDIERLRVLAAQGLSASQISRQFTGISRNAVISKMKRSGIEFMNKRGGRHDTVATLPAPQPSGQPEPVALLSGMAAHHPTPPAVGEESRDTTVSTKDLRWSGQCKFPVTDDAPFMHCGAPANGVYCDTHHARMYSAPRARVVA